MENKIGEEFKSIQPDFTNFEMKDMSFFTSRNGRV